MALDTIVLTVFAIGREMPSIQSWLSVSGVSVYVGRHVLEVGLPSLSISSVLC
jgi:hypothetical protein